MSLLVSESTIKNNPYYNLYINNLYLAVLFKGISFNFKFFDRLSMYFSIFIIFLIPIILKERKLKEVKFLKYFIELLFIIYCFIRIISGQAGVEKYYFF